MPHLTDDQDRALTWVVRCARRLVELRTPCPQENLDDVDGRRCLCEQCLLRRSLLELDKA